MAITEHADPFMGNSFYAVITADVGPFEIFNFYWRLHFQEVLSAK